MIVRTSLCAPQLISQNNPLEPTTFECQENL